MGRLKLVRVEYIFLKILVFSSVGGHFRQAMPIAAELEKFGEVAFVVNGPINQSKSVTMKLHSVCGAGRSLWQIRVLIQCAFLFWRIQPDVVFSTGAAPAVWFMLFGRLTGKQCVFLESWARQESLSLTGRICRFLGVVVFVQSEKLARGVGCRFWDPIERY